MRVMTITERHNNVLFTVSSEGDEYRAIQCVTRDGTNLYANSTLQVDDKVLVAEIPDLLSSPSMLEEDVSDSVSLVIVGLIPPSQMREIQNYDDLVRSPARRVSRQKFVS